MKVLGIVALLLIQGTSPQRLDTGVVAGRLLYVDGTPASEVRVAVMEVAESASLNTGSLLSISKTDKDGKYRLENIPPGHFFILAGLIDSPTFYPGALTPAGARAVQVLAGAIVEKVDFSMLAPAGFKVSGKFSGQDGQTGTTSVMLVSLVKGSMETSVHADGTFEFLNVPNGLYSLQSAFGMERLSVLVADRDIAGLPLSGDPGKRVSGKIVMPGVLPNAMPVLMIMLRASSPAFNPAVPPGNIAPLQGLPAGVSNVPQGGRSTRGGTDGTFEFLKVPPGNYDMEVETGFGPTQTWHVAVEDKDVTGVQLSLPYQLEIPGRIVVEGGSPFQISSTQGMSFQGVETNGTNAIGIVENGAFRLRLREGESRIVLRNLPRSYVVKSMLSGTIDMLQGPIAIAPGQKFEDIVLTVAAVPQESIKGVRVSGQISGLLPGMASTVTASLLGDGPDFYKIETRANPDGSFEFPSVPSGTYTGRIGGPPNVIDNAGRPVRVSVGNVNVTGIQFPVNIRTVVVGRITVVDQTGRTRSDLVPTTTVYFRHANITLETRVSLNGTFSMTLGDGEQSIDLGGFPPQFTIQSITTGSTDLMKGPLKIDHTAPPQEILVRMEFKP